MFRQKWDGFHSPSTPTGVNNNSGGVDHGLSDNKDTMDLSFSEHPGERIDEREREFINPTYKIKISKEAADAGFGSCTRRVDALGIQPFPVHLPADVLDFTVSRQFTSDVYGGNLEQTFPKLGADKQAFHPYRDFMYLNLEHNPYAPQRAGYPGLFFRAGTNIELKEYRLIIRIKPCVCMYLGQYELIPSTPLTKHEWNANGQKTKLSWLKKVIKESSRVDIRARISLRKALGREPTIQEVEECDGSGVTEEDVQLAYSSGQERIGVWAMKCVGYDEIFQREMQQKFTTWVLQIRDSKEPSKTKSSTSKRQRQPGRASKPVKRMKK